MKSNITQIRELLDKFYECETNEEEEDILREYFRGDVAPEFQTVAHQFKYYDHNLPKDTNLSIEFDKKVIESINNYESKSKLKVIRKKSWYGIAVAASLLVIFGMFFLLQSNNNEQSEYNEAMNALILISEKMDVATNELQVLESFDEGFSNFEALIILENYENKIINK